MYLRHIKHQVEHLKHIAEVIVPRVNKIFNCNCREVLTETFILLLRQHDSVQPFEKKIHPHNFDLAICGLLNVFVMTNID